MRWRELAAADVPAHDDAIGAIYDGRFDVVVVRAAFDAAVLGEVGRRLDSETFDPGWERPNQRMPPEDVQLLGTDAPATPTYRAPRGVSLEAYLAGAAAHDGRAAAMFGPGYDAVGEIRAVLARLAGGRPVALARAADGRGYAPFTIRRLADGTQIGLHHDNHYALDLYRELAPQLDTRTLVSFVATLRGPRAGGELVVYGARSDDPAVPRLAGGFAYDLPAVEAAYPSARFVTGAGDLFLLAAGRCLHRVERIVGPPSRVTMGGFLALDRAHERVLFWS